MLIRSRAYNNYFVGYSCGIAHFGEKMDALVLDEEEAHEIARILLRSDRSLEIVGE